MVRHSCMRSRSKTIAGLFGLLAMVVGIALLLDGLLPMRSHGPNPSALEVAVGFVIGLAGFVVRRMARRSPAGPPPAL